MSQATTLKGLEEQRLRLLERARIIRAETDLQGETTSCTFLLTRKAALVSALEDMEVSAQTAGVCRPRLNQLEVELVNLEADATRLAAVADHVEEAYVHLVMFDTMLSGEAPHYRDGETRYNLGPADDALAAARELLCAVNGYAYVGDMGLWVTRARGHLEDHPDFWEDWEETRAILVGHLTLLEKQPRMWLLLDLLEATANMAVAATGATWVDAISQKIASASNEAEKAKEEKDLSTFLAWSEGAKQQLSELLLLIKDRLVLREVGQKKEAEKALDAALAELDALLG